MRKSLSLSALTLASVLASAEPTPAEPSPVRLDDYVVETSPATYRLKAPSVTHQLLRDDLEKLNLPEIENALQHLPNFFIRKRFIGDKNSLTSIRGTSNRQPGRTVVLADGLVLSNFLGTGFGNSPRWFLVAPEEINKIAVSYGPYSALYAGNAIGGTVLLTTHVPCAFQASAKGQYFVQEFDEYGTKDTYSGKTGYVSMGDAFDRLSYFVFINHLDNRSHPMSFATVNVAATQPAAGVGAAATGARMDTDFAGAPRFIYGSQGPTRAVHNTFKLKLGYDLGERLQARYSLIYWLNQEDNLEPETYLRAADGTPIWAGPVDLAGRTFVVPVSAFNVNERRQRDLMHGLTLAHEPRAGLQVTATATVYDVLKDRLHAATTALPSARAGGPGRATAIGDTGWRSGGVLLGWRSAANGRRHAPVAGYHYDTYFTEQEQRDMADWRGSPLGAVLNGNGGRTVTHALFAQDGWKVGKAWTVTPGVRWEAWKARDGFQQSSAARGVYPVRRRTAWSPKLAFAWRGANSWHARLSLARATRFPTVGELFQGTVTAAGAITENNPGLKPERAFAKDFTIERFTPSDRFRASVFEDDVRDALVNQSTLRPDGTSLSGPQNVGRVLTRGLEASWHRKGFLAATIDFDVNASYTRAEIKENAPILVGTTLVSTVGRQFPRIPRWQVKALAAWRATPRLQLSAALRYSSKQYNTLENSDPYGGYGGTDPFLVGDLRVTYTFVRQVSVSLGVDNVTDDRYHVFHPMPGRTWLLEIKLAYP